MCGIAGYLALDGGAVDESELRPMLDAIRHRGPDDFGLHVDGPLAFGMRRLSVIDLHTGHQPIVDPASGHVITYNGETYNYRVLRDELQACGHRFETQTDTEVVLHHFVEHGSAGLPALNGMYAFAIWCPKSRRLVLARDPVGIKPLFWWRGSWQGREWLVWASEMRALMRHPAVPREISPDGISEFLRFGYTFAPTTVMRGIRKLEPGGMLEIEDGRVSEERFVAPPMEQDAGALFATREESSAQVLAALEESVRDQMVADVPVGAFLSGGVDSSGLVALMKRVATGKVATFSIGLGEEDRFHDEAAYAAQFAARLGTEHHELRVQPDLLAQLPRLMGHLDEPLADSSIFVSFLISEMARQHVTVALSGVGGDEIFGGYRRYLGFTLDRWFRGPLGAIARGAVSAGVALLPKSRDSAVGNLARLASRYIAAGGGDAGDGGIGRYTQLVELGTEERLRVLYPAYNTPDPAALQALRKREWRDSLESMTAFDMRGSLPEQLLNLTDRMSMAVSLEVRVPYLDHRVLAAARRTPSQHKIRGRNMRVVQKDALRPLIGDEIITRKKRGFGFPLGRWIRDESSGFIEEHIGRDALADRGLFDPDAVARLRGEHERKEADHTDVLTGLLFFELWARSALDS